MHLTDYVTPLSPEDLAALKSIVTSFTHLTLRVIGKRPAICHWPSESPVQFITRPEPTRVRWMAESWNFHFAKLQEQGRAR